MARWLSWLERRPVTAEVVGSNPIRVVCMILSYGNYIYYGILAQLGEHLPYKQGVTGSSPVGPTRLSKDNQGSRCGGTGRRAGLKILLWQHSTGSIPVTGIRDITHVISLFCVIGNSLKFIVTQNLLWMRVVANTRKLF